MEEILSNIKNEITALHFQGVIRFLRMNHRIKTSNNNVDIDLFLEVSDTVDIFKMIEETSIIVFRMTIRYDILISIYPIKTGLLHKKSNQFLRNINSNSIEF